MGSVYTVSQVTSYIKNMFTQDFALNRVSIKGEDYEYFDKSYRMAD